MKTIRDYVLEDVQESRDILQPHLPENPVEMARYVAQLELAIGRLCSGIEQVLGKAIIRGGDLLA